MRLFLAIVVATAFLAQAFPASADNLDRTAHGKDVTVDVASPFSDLPPGRIVPFRVTIRNDQSFAGTWKIFFQATTNMSTTGETTYEQELTVAASATGVFDVLVPLPISAVDRFGGMNLEIGVTGPGFSNAGGADSYFAHLYSGPPPYSGGGTVTRTPFTLIGNEVVGSVALGPMETFYKARGMAFYGSLVDVAMLPSDWRAYSGIAAFILRDSEWLSLNSAQRQAVCDYVAMGGHLTLFVSDTSDATIAGLQLPEPNAKAGPYGFGMITVNSTSVFPPTEDVLDTALQDNPVATAQNIDQNFSNWGIRHLVGIITVSSSFILLFVIGFGTLIGPVNLFVFAKGKNRFRLFWTTPVISIAASLALVAGILLTDGIGGNGEQLIATFSLPGANREAVIQEQISRTAVLFSTRWHSEQNYLITPISTRSMDNAMGSARERADDYQRDLADASDSYHQEGNDYSGDWFRSRSVSGQYLQAMRPSRSALTIMNPQAFGTGAAPMVLSSFPEKLTRVYLLDSKWHYWTCEDLEPGRKQTCTASTNEEFNRFWNDASVNAGGKLGPLLSRARDRDGYFYATGIPLSSDRLATLGEINWQVTQGIFLGPWVASTAPEGNP